MATTRAPAASPRRLTTLLGRQPLGILFAAPYAVFLAAIFAYPLGLAVWMSFHDYFFAAPGAQVDRPFVGFENYQAVLSDPDVRQSFVNVGDLPGHQRAADRRPRRSCWRPRSTAAIRFRTFLRVSYYVPYVTASVALVAVWMFLFSKDGMVNQILGPLAPDPSWLVNSTLAMPVIAVFVTWKQLGFFILLYLAALQNVSKDLYDAAAVDGASRWGQFRHVTVPGVRPATTLVVILATITGANLFTEPYLLTGGGGPDGASSVAGLRDVPEGHRAGEPRHRGRDRRDPRCCWCSRSPWSTASSWSVTDMTDVQTEHPAPSPRPPGAAVPPTPHRDGAAGPGRAGVPVPLLLHGRRLAAGREPTPRVRGAFPTGGFTLDNYRDIDERVDLVQSLLNSGIFTTGVLLGTVVFGVLAGYALARLHFRGRELAVRGDAARADRARSSC